MGTISNHKPVILITGFISRYPDAIEWGLDQSISKWGPLLTKSELFSFEETNYYEPSMGEDLSCILPWRHLLTEFYQHTFRVSKSNEESGTEIS